MSPPKLATLEVVKQPKTSLKASTVNRATRRQRSSKVAARPSSELHLTRRERAILANPDWVTEDEADIIHCMRHEHEATIPLEEVANELGLPLES